jgi:uncharacterized protein (DUF2147 family)
MQTRIFYLMAPLLLVGALLVSPASAAASGADGLLGTWSLDEQGLVVRIFAAGSTLEGTVVDAPAAALRGKTFLRGLVLGADGAWHGEVFAPRRGTFVPCVARLDGDERLTMTAGERPFTRTLTWRRQLTAAGGGNAP